MSFKNDIFFINHEMKDEEKIKYDYVEIISVMLKEIKKEILDKDEYTNYLKTSKNYYSLI